MSIVMFSLVIDKVFMSRCFISSITSNRANRVPARTTCVLYVRFVSRPCVKYHRMPHTNALFVNNIADGSTTHAFPYRFTFVFGLVDTATIKKAGILTSC